MENKLLNIWESIFVNYNLNIPGCNETFFDVKELDYIRFVMSKSHLKFNRKSPYNNLSIEKPCDKSNADNYMEYLIRICEDMYIRRVKLSQIIDISDKIQRLYKLNLFNVKLPLPVKSVHYKLEKYNTEVLISDVDVIQIIEKRKYSENSQVFNLNSFYKMFTTLDKEGICLVNDKDTFSKIVSITNIMIMIKISYLKDVPNIKIAQKYIKDISYNVEKFWREYYRTCKIGYKSIFMINYNYI